MAAVATRCPACGGDVHPLAGRCKHCKADLALYRHRAARALPHPAAEGTGSHQAVSPAAPDPDLSPPVPGYAPALYAPAPAPARSRLAQRWPLAVAAIALLAIGFSLGMLFERERGSAENPAPMGTREGASPRPVPDLMPPQPPRR